MDRAYRSINGNNLQMLMKKGNVVLIDVRSVQDYNKSHIPKAINIPFEILQNKKNIPYEYKNLNVIVYCKSGIKSSKVAALLYDNGFKNVYNLSGGISSYKGELVR